MDKNLFFYWEGPQPSLISLLRKLIFKHSNEGENYKPIFLNDANIADYIDIPEFYNNMIYAHKADFIRAAVVNKFGGIYIDSDTLVTPSMLNMFDLLESNDGFFVRTIEGHICNGIFGSKKQTDFMQKWEEIIRMKIDRWQGKFGWTEIGSKVINYEIDQSLLSNYQVLDGPGTVYPVFWKNCVDEFLNKPVSNISKIRKTYQPAIVLVNSVYKAVQEKTEEELMMLKNPLGQLLRESFGVENEN